MRGMSFPEALEFLAEKAHLPLPEDARRSSGAADQTKIFSRINRAAAEFYHQRFTALPETHPARVYAHKRGLTKELISQFQIGWSGHAHELARHFQSLKMPLESADRLGLVKPSRDGHGHYDMFRDRLMFPIVSNSGNHIGFGGRVLDDSLPKYLNSPETPVFSKGRTLYGLNETAKFIRTDDSVLVVEGYMDFLGLFGAGIRNVVATLGTALTRDHASVLKRHTKNVVLLFDGDSAGQKASFRSLPILLSDGLFPRAITLPDDLDPDDFVRQKGSEALRSRIREAPDLFFKYLEMLQQKYGRQPSDKVHLIQEAAQVLHSASEPALRDLYIAEVAARIGVQTPWLKRVMEGKAVSQPEGREPARPVVPESAAGPARTTPKTFPREERAFLNLLLWKEKYLKATLEMDISSLISDEALRDVYGMIAQAYRHSPTDFDKLTGLLFNKFDDGAGGDGASMITAAITDHLNPRVFNFSEEDGDKLFRDCLVRMKEKAFKQRARNLIQDLKNDQGNSKLEQFVNELKNRSLDLPK
jgi:DNA primase